MDESLLIKQFSEGTYNANNLRGKTFDVEILFGFKDLGFDGYWKKRFRSRKLTGDNRLGRVEFGEFKVAEGLWSGYQCVMLDYGPGFVRVRDYMRQVGDHTWLGVYEVGGRVKGWFHLTEEVR